MQSCAFCAPLETRWTRGAGSERPVTGGPIGSREAAFLSAVRSMKLAPRSSGGALSSPESAQGLWP